MPEISIDQTDIAEKAYDAVKALVDTSPLEAVCEYEYLPTNESEMPAFGFFTLTGDPIEKMYLDGSYLANYRFSIILRQSAQSTRERLDAVALLRALADAFVGAPIDIPGIVQRRKDTLPSRMSADDTYVDYQVTLRINYKSHL